TLWRVTLRSVAVLRRWLGLSEQRALAGLAWLQRLGVGRLVPERDAELVGVHVHQRVFRFGTWYTDDMTVEVVEYPKEDDGSPRITLPAPVAAVLLDLVESMN